MFFTIVDCVKYNNHVVLIYILKAINGLGNQQDVNDAAEAKSKSLDYNSLKELVYLDRRLNYHTNKLDQHTIKIEKLETTVEVMEKGNISKIYIFFFKTDV